MIKVVKNDNYIEIYTPYNAKFVSKVKKLGARWLSEKKAWVTIEENLNYVRDILMEVYGESDICIPEYVDIEIRFLSETHEGNTRSDFHMFGRPLLLGWGRDSGVKVNENVSIVQGNAITTGSMKNWYIELKDNPVLVLRNLPITKYEEYKDTYDFAEIKVIKGNTEPKKSMLQKYTEQITENNYILEKKTLISLIQNLSISEKKKKELLNDFEGYNMFFDKIVEEIEECIKQDKV